MARESWTEASRVGGKPTKSLTVLLRTRGCSYAKRQGPCRFCAFHGFAEKNPKELGPDKLRAKVEGVIAAHDFEAEGIGELKIYNGGSFFADAEIRPKEREAVLSVIARHRLRKLSVEARPEHVARKKILEAREALGLMELEVAMGLETSDDALRSRLNKGFMLVDFYNAAWVLAECGATLGAYVLIKPVPMSEEEARADALSSLDYLSGLRERLGLNISARLEPFSLYKGMEAEPGHSPASLATVIRIIKEAPDNLDLFLGCSEGEAALSEGAAALEMGRMKNAVDLFNSTGDRRAFEAR